MLFNICHVMLYYFIYFMSFHAAHSFGNVWHIQTWKFPLLGAVPDEVSSKR